ncbi:MAG: hypothetical protein JJT78_13790 [Leptospira sp.]|nr:hypothetical protein [Leptospira sp.]
MFGYIIAVLVFLGFIIVGRTSGESIEGSARFLFIWNILFMALGYGLFAFFLLILLPGIIRGTKNMPKVFRMAFGELGQMFKVTGIILLFSKPFLAYYLAVPLVLGSTYAMGWDPYGWKAVLGGFFYPAGIFTSLLGVFLRGYFRKSLKKGVSVDTATGKTTLGGSSSGGASLGGSSVVETSGQVVDVQTSDIYFNTFTKFRMELCESHPETGFDLRKDILRINTPFQSLVQIRLDNTNFLNNVTGESMPGVKVIPHFEGFGGLVENKKYFHLGAHAIMDKDGFLIGSECQKRKDKGDSVETWFNFENIWIQPFLWKPLAEYENKGKELIEDFPVHYYAQSSYLSTYENSMEDSFQPVERMDLDSSDEVNLLDFPQVLSGKMVQKDYRLDVKGYHFGIKIKTVDGHKIFSEQVFGEINPVKMHIEEKTMLFLKIRINKIKPETTENTSYKVYVAFFDENGRLVFADDSSGGFEPGESDSGSVLLSIPDWILSEVYYMSISYFEGKPGAIL